MRTKLFFTAAAAFLLATAPAGAQAPDPEGRLVEELVVNAPVRGPAWWRVSDADSTVYIMATPTLAPNDLSFDTTVLERRLEGANVLILPPKVEPHVVRLILLLTRGRKIFLESEPWLQSVSPELRERYLAYLRRSGRALDRYDKAKPAFVGFMLAYSDPGGNVQLGLAQVPERAEQLAAKRADPPKVRKLNGYDFPKGLAALSGAPRPLQELCLDAGLRQAESGSGGLRRNAELWAIGDSRAYALAERGYSACLAATPSIAAEIRRGIGDSTKAIEAALKQPGKSVALVEFRPLLAADGVLDRLRRKGYAVTVPGQEN